MKITILTLSVLIAFLIIIGCKKEATGTFIQIKLTDAPAAYEEVNIDLKQVRVNYAKDTSGWIDLTTQAGIYNLLALQNNVQTLIGTGTVPDNKIYQVRLVLGSNNTIKENGVVYPLIIPSGAESGLKLKINKKLGSDAATIVVDFDAALSVIKEKNGKYMLKPVLKLK